MSGRLSPVPLAAALIVLLATLGPGPRAHAGSAAAALPSWNDGAARSAIVDFVARVTREGGLDFVPPRERIATFDNDGTLWCEQPVYVQAVFALDRARVM